MKKIFAGAVIVFLLIFLLPGVASSWVVSSARGLGLGGAYTSLPRSTEAIFENPAFLSFGKNSYFSFLSFGAKIENNSFSLNDYNAYNGRFLDQGDKDDILSAIPEKGFSLSGDAGASLLGAKIGKFGLASRVLGVSDFNFPKEPLEILLNGNSLDQRVELSDLRGEALVFFEVAFSGATKIASVKSKPLFAGVNVKWIKGIYYQKITESSGFFETEKDRIHGQGYFSAKSAEGGSGYSFDLGLGSFISDKVTVGLCLVNILSSIKWNKKTQKRWYRISTDSLTIENSDDDSVYLEEDYTEDIGSFNSKLPLIVKGGVSYKLNKLTLSTDLEQGFKNSAGSSRIPKLSLGTEFTWLSWLKLRSGLIFGGKEKFATCWGLGFKIGNSFIDLGMSIKNSLWPSKGKGMGVLLSSGLSF